MWDVCVITHYSENQREWQTETYKVQEAATHFMIRVGVGLQKLFNHGQEVPVHRQDLFQVRKQHLWGKCMERLTY